ncbi:hypothetical protein BDV18DRAFT_142649 [Aspergillus unguis]
MYNPWSTHPSQSHPHHAHHAHHGHHPQVQAHHPQAPAVTTVSGTVPGTVTSGTRLDLPLDTSPAGSSSQQSPAGAYPMSASGQIRWLPSMITPRTHNSHNASLPTISSGLRMQHPGPGTGTNSGSLAPTQTQTHRQQQGRVPMVMQGRAAGQPLDTGVGLSQAAQVVTVGSESDRSDTPSGTPGARDVGGADVLGEPDFGGGASKVDRNGDLDVDVLGENANGKVGNGDMSFSPGMNLSTRKHGKRLTTKEEVSLFEICNKHAAEFGQRSNLCKWWMTVTTEFTRGQKHPYSWHSVRRKVEVVTKQRMKFLEEQRDKGASEAEDLSNPRWRAVVDAWIPTWQRWEDAETRRIEKRDSKRPRKRKFSGTGPTSAVTAASTAGRAGDWDMPTSAQSTGREWRAASSEDSSPAMNHRAPSPTPLSSNPVRLPPGFDTLFSQSSQKPPSTTSTSTPYNYPSHNPNNLHNAHNNNNSSTPSTNTSTNHTPITAPATTSQIAAPDNAMMAAMLETLGKLNKHLDSSNNPTASPSSLLQNLNSNVTGTPLSNPNSEPPSAQPMPATQDTALDGGAGGMSLNDELSLQTLHTATLSRLKEELKAEMMTELRAEWDKERAALEEKLDDLQRTQEMILEMLRQEPSS